jgi:hypothetical protein
MFIVRLDFITSSKNIQSQLQDNMDPQLKQK